MNLVGEREVVTVASSDGAVPKRRPREESLCAVALDRPGTTVIHDTWLDADACRVPATRGESAVRTYVAAKVQDTGGRTVGVLCVYDTEPHRTADVDLDLLQDLALLVEGELIDARRRAG